MEIYIHVLMNGHPMHAAIMHNPENAPGLGGNALVDRKCIMHNAWTLQRSVSPSATYAFLALANTSLICYFLRRLATQFGNRARAVPIIMDPLPTKETLTAAHPTYLGSCSGVQV